MGTERDSHDDAIDKVLAAMRNAAQPEGMDTRILERLQLASYASAAPHPSNSTATSAWWRGAFTGALIATVAICAMLLLQHRLFSRPGATPQTANTQVALLGLTPVTFAAGHTPQSSPCPASTLTPRHPGARNNSASRMLLAESLTESIAPSHPAPEAPLSMQERELARLVHIANPSELTSVNPENQARLQEQEAAEFEKFFTPPPPPSANNE